MTVPVSFEVYPPRSPEKLPGLKESIRVLDSVSPDFISVTFGAGGSSTRDSLEVLRFIRDESSATPLAHLTCVGTTRQEASELVVSFLAEGITHFLALRGDLPEGALEHRGELHNAVDLVTLMHELPDMPKPLERIAVAAFPNGHPESDSLDHDVETLLRKQEAGATLAITQLFFFTEDYLTFVGKAHGAGITIPILPGLMPVVSPSRLNRVVELSGENRPAELSEALSSTEDAAAREAIGVDWTAKMVRELVDAGAPGIHLYAFNQHRTVLSVLEQSGVR
ncbi:MAG: 5,10-methylenetetrahydrofolate reductase [Actinobacteria bacterium]|nr:5,10-methylenetetrahydrofolate reductase [Actinomycetota bacterium]